MRLVFPVSWTGEFRVVTGNGNTAKYQAVSQSAGLFLICQSSAALASNNILERIERSDHQHTRRATLHTSATKQAWLRCNETKGKVNIIYSERAVRGESRVDGRRGEEKCMIVVEQTSCKADSITGFPDHAGSPGACMLPLLPNVDTLHVITEAALPLNW